MKVFVSRMSARFVARKVRICTTWKGYDLWNSMGIVAKNKFGDWALTKAGREIRGRMSKSNYCTVPTFDFNAIEQLMIDACKEHRK